MSEDKEVLDKFLTEVAEAPERVQRDDHVVAIKATALEAAGRGDEAANMRQEKIDAGSCSAVFYADQAKWLLDIKGDEGSALMVLDLARQRGDANDFIEAIYASALESAGRGDEAATLRQEKIDAGSLNPAFYNDHAIWLLDKQDNADAALKVLAQARSKGCFDEATQKIYNRAIKVQGK